MLKSPILLLKALFCSPFLLVILFLVSSPLFGKIPALPGRPSPWQGDRASKAAGRQLREDRVFSLHAWRWGTQSEVEPLGRLD